MTEATNKDLWELVYNCGCEAMGGNSPAAFRSVRNPRWTVIEGPACLLHDSEAAGNGVVAKFKTVVDAMHATIDFIDGPWVDEDDLKDVLSPATAERDLAYLGKLRESDPNAFGIVGAILKNGGVLVRAVAEEAEVAQ